VDDSDNNFAARSLTAPPTVAARVRPVLWEPIEGTGERVVALLCVEPADDCVDEFSPGTHVILRADRLRAILGRHRGDAAFRVLAECAGFMTSRQIRGEPIEQIRPLFQGFALGMVNVARGYSVEQLLDAAVRTVSAFGSSDSAFAVEAAEAPSTTRRTAEFLRQIRRAYAAGDEDRQRRFHVRLQHTQSAPEVWLDYANGPVVMQVASVPSSPNQAPPAAAELKAKLLDLEVVRSEFGDNPMRPTLMLNVRALEGALDGESSRIARHAHSQIHTLAEWAKLKVVEVSSASAAARILETL
jgi:hypothetical protein